MAHQGPAVGSGQLLFAASYWRYGEDGAGGYRALAFTYLGRLEARNWWASLHLARSILARLGGDGSEVVIAQHRIGAEKIEIAQAGSAFMGFDEVFISTMDGCPRFAGEDVEQGCPPYALASCPA